jgi:2-C-methyl-D-erythritol 2,4-cyclodiphosphate synthase
MLLCSGGALMRSIARIGQGYDLHRLAAGRKLVLAGVEIASEQGLTGHSDADVVLHAVIDALLGAAGLGDIGEHFPDTDPAYKNSDSAPLLEQVRQEVERLGYAPVNVDLTVIAEKPKLQPHKSAMRQKLADLLKIGLENVNIKAKTNEGVGEIGACQAIACHAVVSLSEKE